MTIQEHIDYWIDSAESDLIVSESLFNNGHYLWCLFLSHLILEKVLKAHFVKVNEETPPKIHDLFKLAEKSSLNLITETQEFLKFMNIFQISARYPEYKNEINKMCTQEFTAENYIKTKEIFQWLKALIQS
jgi:HEPN domain-containing protein